MIKSYDRTYHFIKSEQKINRDSANWQQFFKHFNKY